MVLPAVGLYSKKEEYSSAMLEACLLPEIFSKKIVMFAGDDAYILD